MKYKAIIIDDEPRARELLREMVRMYTPELEIVAECADLTTGVKSIRKHKPELVLLDIEMPNHSGLELLDFFDEKEVDFSIIFTTAYNTYAIKAFKLSAIDYLTKPIEPGELTDAVERFKKKTGQNAANYSLLKENLAQKGTQRIAVPTGNITKLLEPKQILFLKADSSYTEIHLTDNSTIIVSRTLKNFEDAFDESSSFFRCHKSYIINLRYITAYVKSDSHVVLNEKINIPITSERLEELTAKVKMIKR